MSTQDDADIKQDDVTQQVEDAAPEPEEQDDVTFGETSSVSQKDEDRRGPVEFDYKTGSFVRARTPRKTAGKIDDLAQDDSTSASYTHDSNITVGGGAFSGGHKYHKSRRNHANVQRGQYGQYLEIPKGKRSIFSSREHDRRQRLMIAAVIGAVLFVIVVLFLLKLASGQ